MQYSAVHIWWQWEWVFSLFGLIFACSFIVDSTELNTKLISTYSILVPYVNLPDEQENLLEFSMKNGMPTFHIPFFFGIVNSQVLKLHFCKH